MMPLRALPRRLPAARPSHLQIASARRLDEFIQEQLESRMEWHERSGSGAWICPYCLAAAPVKSVGEKAFLESIEEHLAVRCGPFGAGWAADPGPRPLGPADACGPSWHG